MHENPLAGMPYFAPFTMTEADFDAAVQAAIAGIPADLRAQMDNVVIFIAENYTPGPDEDPRTVLLGLYEGVPLTERGFGLESGSLPDRITIFRQPILAACTSYEEVVHEVIVTVTHEIAHHFGIDDDRLHELGWG